MHFSIVRRVGPVTIAAAVVVAGATAPAAAATTRGTTHSHDAYRHGVGGSDHGGFVGQWPVAGQNADNTRYQAAEDDISPANARSLVPRWSVTTAGDVLATPTVYQGSVYVPDNGGKLWAVRASTGRVEWSRSVSSYTGVAGDTSRSSPAVYRDKLILGDQWIFQSNASGAKVFAVDRHNGKLRWITAVDSNPASIVTSSPVVYDGVVYVGISSKDEPLAKKISGFHSTFRGAIVALNADTGQLLWKTYTVPSNNGGADSNKPGYYSGGAVWGSNPVIDPARGLLFIGTGNNYTVPAGICTQPGQSGCTPPPPSDHVDSILALNLHTGAVVWSDDTLASDSWTAACTQPICGPDFDLGSAPNLYTTTNPATGQPEQLLGIGQKSGVYWALDPATGHVVWHTQVGPGGKTGGIEWGSATDGKRIYVAEADTSNTPYTLGGSGPYAGRTISSGSWGALDAATGKILWQTPDPQRAWDIGYVSAANGVVYTDSTAPSGANMFALDADTGHILWSFASGGAVMSGAAIVGHSVYWGSGYYTSKSCQSATNPLGICITSPTTAKIGASNKLYAFSPTVTLPGEHVGR